MWPCNNTEVALLFLINVDVLVNELKYNTDYNFSSDTNGGETSEEGFDRSEENDMKK